MSRGHRIKRNPAPVHSPVCLELIDEATACQIIGGTKPISKYSLYRGIAAGRFPRAVRVGPNAVRYVRTEVEGVVRAAIAERTAPSSLAMKPAGGAS
jgi:predicted DNA-binding transcriptional regulator AlpA